MLPVIPSSLNPKEKRFPASLRRAEDQGSKAWRGIGFFTQEMQAILSSLVGVAEEDFCDGLSFATKMAENA